ncbi:MAG: hypothetical protein ACYTG1_13525 [Planctomycetota bacterium]|jgi:hypothetical protein
MPPARLLLLLAVLLPLAGCYSRHPLSVDVRDRDTLAPVDGAVVVVHALNMYRPGYPHALVHPSPARTVRAVTGPDGTARFAQGAPAPATLVVYRAGQPPQTLALDEHPGDTGAATEWLTPAPPGDGADDGATVEVRLRPPS